MGEVLEAPDRENLPATAATLRVVSAALFGGFAVDSVRFSGRRFSLMLTVTLDELAAIGSNRRHVAYGGHDRRADQTGEPMFTGSCVVFLGGTRIGRRQAALEGNGIQSSFLPFAEWGRR